ncbi:MAG: LacI family DNA-binding transcriptional regulator [Lautropia sp.]
MDNKQKTLKDIASELGLSHTTVSRALNDHPRISPETRALVRSTSDRLGYVVNSSARRLRGHPSALIGLIVPEIRNPVFSEIARIVSEHLSGTHYQLVLAVTGDDPEREERSLRALAEAQATGVLPVLSPMPTLGTIRLLHRLRTTMLIRQHRAVAADYVGLDEQQAIACAVEHLTELGHREIGFVGIHTLTSTGTNRLHGFMDACARASLATDTRQVLLGPSTDNFGRQAMGALFEGPVKPPTAVVIGGAQQALGCMQWLQEHNLRTPEHLSVVTFGDPPWMNLIHGGLTAVRLPVPEIAQAAARLVLQHAETTAMPRARTIEERFPSTLVKRCSSGPPRKR